MDTSVLQFYPTLFVLVTDIMDMVGDMVWERIKLKAEFAENGRKHHSLPGCYWSCSSYSVVFLYSRGSVFLLQVNGQKDRNNFFCCNTCCTYFGGE